MTDITHIEEMLAHQEQQISELNDIVTRQADKIDGLNLRLGRMRDKMNVIEDMAQSSGGEVIVDKPPHY